MKKLKPMVVYAIKHNWADDISLSDIFYSKESAKSQIKKPSRGGTPLPFEVIKLSIKQVK